MNAAYRHLESKTRIGELTLGQWAGILLGVLVAVVFAVVLKPFSGYVNLALGIYIGGLPAAAVFLASISDLDVWLTARSALRLSPRRRALPTRRRKTSARLHDPIGRRHAPRRRGLDLGALWDDQPAANSRRAGQRREPDRRGAVRRARCCAPPGARTAKSTRRNQHGTESTRRPRAACAQ